MTQPPSLLPPDAQYRTSRRCWALRILACAIVVLALGYTSIPFWLPTDFLRRQLESDLSRQFGSPVRIRQLKAGWIMGVTLHDLTIADDRPGHSGQVLHVGQVRCELAPLTLLMGYRVRELEIFNPHIWIEIDRDGQINIGDLGAGRGGRLLTLNYAVHGLVFHVITPDVTQTFRLDRIDLQLDPRTGLLHLTSATRVHRTGPAKGEAHEGRLDFDANVRVPRLKKTEQLNGEIRAEWTGLALNDLPVPIMSRVPVEQVDGTSNGSLTLKTHPDLGVDFALNVLLNGVRIMRPELHRPAQVPDADISFAGHWDPNNNTVAMKTLRYETPGLRIEPASDDRPALYYDEHGQTSLDVHLRGNIKSWDELHREIPEVEQLTRMAQSKPKGNARFGFDFTRSLHEDFVRVALDASESSWACGPQGREYLRAKSGVPKTCLAELLYDHRTHRVSTRTLSLRFSDLSVDASGELGTNPAQQTVGPLQRLVPQGDDVLQWVFAVLPSVRAEIVVKSPDVGALRPLLPCLEQSAELLHISGPTKLTVGIQPEVTSSRMKVTVEIPAESSWVYADLIDKRLGQPLKLQLDAAIPYADSGRLSVASAELQYGEAHLAMTTGKDDFEYSLAFDPLLMNSSFNLARAKAAWAFDLRIRSLQDLLDLSPRLRQLQGQLRVDQLLGDCVVDCRSQLSYRPDETSIQSHTRLLADDLALEWSENLKKMAGDPLDIAIHHSWRKSAGGKEQEFTADVRRRSGNITGTLSLPTSAGNGPPPPIQVTASANFTNIGDWLAISPRLLKVLGENHPTGTTTLSAQAELHGRRQSGHITLDATKLDFLGKQHDGWCKPAGLPATADITWHTETPAEGSHAHHWAVDQAHLQFAECTIDHLNADITIEPPKTRLLDLRDLCKSVRGKLASSGKLVVSEEVKTTHPLVRKWIDELQLDGATTWQVNAQISPELATTDFAIDATDTTMTFYPYGDPKQRIVKPIGDTMTLMCSASANHWLPPGQRELTVNQAAFNLLDSSLKVQGHLGLDDLASSKDVRVSLRLPHAEKLRHMLPNSPVQTLRGGLQVDLSLDAPKQRLGFNKGYLALDNFQFGSAERPLMLQGEINLVQDKLLLDGIDWRWGRSAGTFSGMLQPSNAGFALQLALFGQYIHVEDLFACAADLQSCLPHVNTAPTVTFHPDGRKRARQIVDLLRRSRASVEARVGTVVTPLPLDIKAVLDAAWEQLTLEDGKVVMNFACLVDGGRVTGDVTMDLNAAVPTYRLTYTAERIQAGNVTKAYLRRTFPGMEAMGPLTLIDESNAKLLPTPGETNYETGKGQIIIDGGVIAGRAAPLWVTKIFPGLNLASFDFTRMHSWFDKTASGRTTHQMIYRGTYYHVYMIGWSEQDGTFKYEVGVDFLAGLESEYWANTGQGRVPLFTKTGQVMPDGTLKDETVTFVSLQRVLETLFVNNNPLVTAYYGVMKRVEGRQ